MDEISYKLFRQELGKEIFKIPVPYQGKELALCLSGGIDSGVLCAIFSKQRPDLRTYSIGLKEANEFKAAAMIAKKFKTKHMKILVTKKEYKQACREIIKLKKYPVQVPNEALIYLIAKRFKKDIGNKKGVLLLGEGADELFGGYTGILNTVPYKEGNLLDNHIFRIVYDKMEWIWLEENNKRKYKKIFKDNDIKASNYDRVQNWLKRLHYPALLQRLRSANLVKGITADVPYANPMFVMISEALPRTMRVNKTFLRICFGEIMPRETMEQEKIAFGLPLNLNQWQEWNLEIFKKGKSKIDFWK